MITREIAAKVFSRMATEGAGSGNTQFERDDKSGVVEGKSYIKSYMMSGSPYERINRLTHATMYDLMRKAADDVRLQQAANSSAAAPK